MNKKIQNTIKHHKKILITVAAVVVVVMAFVLQGWFRWTVLPEAVQPFYTPSVKNDFNTQRINAYDPVQTLAGKSVKTFASCSTVMLQNIHTQLDCQASQAQDYSKLPTTDSSKQILNESIQKLEAALTEQGYKAGSNGVTLSSLVQGTYQGKDYSPDAYYAKRIGKYTCVFDTMIAYANPQPPAIRTSYQCSRTVNILGTPNTDVGGSGGYESIIQPPAH